MAKKKPTEQTENNSFVSFIQSKEVNSRWWKSKHANHAGYIIFIVIIFMIIIWWFFFHPYVSTDDARVSAVLVRIANQGAGGRIENINVSESDRVKKGMILAEIDHRPAMARLDLAKARALFAESEFRRAQGLAVQKGIALRELEKARSDAQIADAEMRLAEVALEYTYLRSQVDGIVVQKATEAGNNLETGQVAFTIADIDHAWIAANIEETSVALIKPGQPVMINIDEGGTMQGRVLEVRKAAAAQFALIPSDNASGNFIKVVQRIPIKVELDPHQKMQLRIGQSVEIRIRVR
jgi:multidrug resistance efflux pump